jgi:hypothetical protein
VPSATYLGLDFHSAHGLFSTCASREKKMWGAWAALQREYAGLHCGVSLSLLFRVHQACVPPVASYGCELWGLRVMPSRLTAARDRLTTGHVNMLRQILGLRKSTPHAIVFLESGGTSHSLMASLVCYILEQSWCPAPYILVSACASRFCVSGPSWGQQLG